MTDSDDGVRRDRWGRYLVVPPEGGKPRPYTRATTVAKTLDDGGGLMPWKATMAMTGLMRRPGLRGRLEALMVAHPEKGPWYGSNASKAACKKLVEECADAGGASDRAEQGIADHAIFEHHDRGLPVTVLQDQTRADLDAYIARIASSGITFDVAGIEAMIVLDEWQVAGKSDRLVTRIPGLALPVVADLKTGTELTYSWQSIAVQMAVYAHADNIYIQGAADDGCEDRRIEVPTIDRERALIIHAPVGEARCDLYIVDIAAGWEAFQLSMAARQWRTRKNLSTQWIVPSASQASAGEAPPAPSPSGVPASTSEHSSEGEAPTARVTQPADAFDGLVDGYVAPPATPERRAWIVERLTTLRGYEGALERVAAAWPPGLASLKQSDAHTDADLDRVAAVLDEVEADFVVSWNTPDPGKPKTERAPLTSFAPPEEGPTLGEPEHLALAKRLGQLDRDQHDMVVAWSAEANRDGRSYSFKELRSTRRFAIILASIELADAVYDVDEVARALIGAAMAYELQPTMSTGQALGSLTIDEATRLRTIAIAFGDGRVPLTFVGDRPVFDVAAALAAA